MVQDFTPWDVGKRERASSTGEVSETRGQGFVVETGAPESSQHPWKPLNPSARPRELQSTQPPPGALVSRIAELARAGMWGQRPSWELGLLARSAALPDAGQRAVWERGSLPIPTRGKRPAYRPLQGTDKQTFPPPKQVCKLPQRSKSTSPYTLKESPSRAETSPQKQAAQTDPS